MDTVMEGCQSAELQIVTVEQLGQGALGRFTPPETFHQATVNCPILKFRGQEPQTGKPERYPRAAVGNLGATMGLVACNNCPISRMDLLQGAKYLADVAIERAVIQELIERGDLPQNWQP